MPTALILLADGFEEMELVVPWDMLKRGGVEVRTASIHEHTGVRSARGMVISADTLLSEVSPGYGDVLVLPGGGPGTTLLRQTSAVRQHILVAASGPGWIAAICAAPLVLGDAGLLQGRRATCYPSSAGELASMGALIEEAPVVVDGRIITARGAGAAPAFGYKLLEVLQGETTAAEVWHQMVFSGAPGAL